MAKPNMQLPNVVIKELGRRLDQQMQKAEEIARAGGDVAGFLERLRLPEDGSKDFLPFDPASLRIKPGRVHLPGVGWVGVDGLSPAAGARLTEIEIRPKGGDFMVQMEFEAA